jgi:hypothetical protein
MLLAVQAAEPLFKSTTGFIILVLALGSVCTGVILLWTKRKSM